MEPVTARPSNSAGEGANKPSPSLTDKRGAATKQLIRVECNPGADMLDYTHSFFSDYSEDHFRPHVAQKVTLAAFELLANGLKFGTMSEKVVIELLQSNDRIIVRVTNSTIPARIAMLGEHLEKIRANPEATYVEEMRKSMSGGQRAMLGLARLAHEARLELFTQIEGVRVIVEAHCPG